MSSTVQAPVAASVTLSDVLRTDQLAFRNNRTADLRAENIALHSLARDLLGPPEVLLDNLLSIALQLCHAGSVGISVVEPEAPEEFHWIAMAGAYKNFVGGTTPRHFSPCGTTADAGSPQLFYHPARLFTHLSEAKPAIVEGLVVPFQLPSSPAATIWVASHDEETKFDMEDVRFMTSLAAFASVAVHRINRAKSQRAN